MKTRVIRPWMRKYVRAQAERFMDCTIDITRPDTPTLNLNTGLMTSSTLVTIYTGKARIWGVDGGGSMNVGDAIIPIRTTYVSIPWSTVNVPWVDDLVNVVEAEIDPNLVNRVFRVMTVDGGGLTAATRRLQVTSVYESSDWND